jgi:hypothetical protein
MTKAEERLQPWDDLIVSEVRQAREALFAESGYDLKKFTERLRLRQADSGRQVVTRSPKRPSQDSGEAA